MIRHFEIRKIFKLTKEFPVEERYSMVDQIRRASRSVCSNLSESWRKRKYIEQSTFDELDREYEEIIAMLNSIENKAEKFCF